ncbi:pyocin knob domain-containing protein [Bacteroides sp. GD17]|jgi:hypothetical protein|uniref:pyocin knob domain-containing protein n=1 Tax=Bacteroides sp. GD17 TaxID=3139826 RepID=UPI00313C074F
MIETIDISNALGQLAPVTDVAYIYGGTDNSQGKIKKSDLLSAMFQYRGEVTVDYNNFKNSGIYQIYDSSRGADNSPDGILYGVLVVFKTTYYLFQIAVEVRPTVMLAKLRTNSGTMWSTWKSITLT